MAVDFTTLDLIKSVKRRGSIPTSQSLYTTDDIIELCNDELETVIVPLMMSVREEYFIYYKDFTISPTSIPVSVEIPDDAIGMSVRDICWVSENEQLTNLPRIIIEQASGMYNESLMNYSGFLVQNNKITLYPSTAGGVLRVFYPRRPLKLTSIAKSGQVLSVNTTTNEIVLTSVPAIWAVGNIVNTVSQKQPFATTLLSGTITLLSSPTVTLDTVVGIQVGDWVSLEGYSTIPQIPVECHKILAQATAVKCLESLGDQHGLENAIAKLNQNIQDIKTVINPRVEGASKKITSCGNGIMDGNRSRRRF